MSFSDQPGYGSAKLLGCLAMGLLGCMVVAFCLVAAAMGHCGTEVDGTGCENEGLIKTALFPGSLIAFIVLGVFAARRVTKDRD